MQITMNNHNSPEYEAMFDDLIREVFGFSFAPWFERKLWDERYESYSIIDDGQMLANTCIFKTDMCVMGQPMRAHQFGGVAVRPSARGRGLSRMIIEHILEKYPDTPAFLGANPSVIDFYPKYGFKQVPVCRPIINATIDNPTAPSDLRSTGDPELHHALENNACYSKVLDCLNSQPVQVFNLIMGYPESIYYLPHSGAFAVCKQADEKLFIAGIFSSSPMAFSAIAHELPFSGVTQVEFGFNPDWLGIEPEWTPIDAAKEPYFVRGDWHLPEHFRFPALSET